MVRIGAEGFAALVEMEGERWAEEQRRKPDSPYGYFRMEKAWHAKQASEWANDPDAPLTDFAESAGEGPVIYGDGGWRRYYVRADGEIKLIASSARVESQEKARQLGFSLT